MQRTLLFAFLTSAALVGCHRAATRPSEAEAAAAADATIGAATASRAKHAEAMMMAAPPAPPSPQKSLSFAGLPAAEVANTEQYEAREDNPIHRTSEQPVSTFSVDVDTGSYSNVRRMLSDGIRPPADAVRTEEFINYFHYGHPAPTRADTPFRVTTELAPAPWNTKRQLLMVGIKGYEVPAAKLPPANLVLLIDTSGSMEAPDKLPLLKRSLALLVRQLRPQDRVSVVVYAGSAGLVLPPTPGDRQGEILAALERLQAGGNTNGGEGIQLAYAMARQAFIPGGVNRVLLATDGDFNVGVVDRRALETLVADQRQHGIALSTLGFGQGNYNDEMAERLADVGDGNHAYIDTVLEARRVLVQQMGGTLHTIARDVKVQVEFNPAHVAEYRLIGYENRLLRREDFANDKVDAGDIGAGHEVTALYEITPAGSGAERIPALRYGGGAAANGTRTGELAHLRLRYKQPGGTESRLIETAIPAGVLAPRPSNALRLAAGVAGFADALRGGTHLEQWNWNAIEATVRGARGADPDGQRTELLRLVQMARSLSEVGATAGVSE